MSTSTSPIATASATPLPEVTNPDERLNSLPSSVITPTNASTSKVHNLGIILVGQCVLPLLLIGAGYLLGKQLSFTLKNQITDPAVPLSPLLNNIKNLSTTSLGALGVNAALLCFRQAATALNQNHSFAQFLTDDLLTPTLTAGYNVLSNPAVAKFFSGYTPGSSEI